VGGLVVMKSLLSIQVMGNLKMNECESESDDIYFLSGWPYFLLSFHREVAESGVSE
jgi:hypothetical protein